MSLDDFLQDICRTLSKYTGNDLIDNPQILDKIEQLLNNLNRQAGYPINKDTINSLSNQFDRIIAELQEIIHTTREDISQITYRAKAITHYLKQS